MFKKSFLALNFCSRRLLSGKEPSGIDWTKQEKAVEIFWKVHEEYFYGLGIDIHWRENNIVPTEEALFEMIIKKDGPWFAMPVQLMQLFSTNNTDYSDLATDIGVYYALVDDYFNLFLPDKLQTLSVKTKRENYAPANDITESKMTLAIVHASQFPDVAPELKVNMPDILKQRTSDLNLVNRALSLIKKHGTDEYAREVLKKIDCDLREKIDRLGGNPKLVAFLDDLHLY